MTVRVLTASLALGAVASASLGGSTVCVSVDLMGVPTGGTAPVLSADGRFVAFGSSSDQIVPDDSNFAYDIFVYDRYTGQVSRASVATGGAQTNELFFPDEKTVAISADGRWVAFESSAMDVVPSDTNFLPDVFVHDRLLVITERVSVSSAGGQATDGGSYAPSISANGRYVAFISSASDLVPDDQNLAEDVFVHDRAMGVTVRASVRTGGIESGGLGDFFVENAIAISGNGRFVVFTSEASDLVPMDQNGGIDVFVHDLQSLTTECVSVDAQGLPAAGAALFNGGYVAISDDGRFVAFESESASLVVGDSNGLRDVFVRDRQLGITTLVSIRSDGAQTNQESSIMPAIAADGRFVSFMSKDSGLVAGDTNNARDIFVHDRLTGTTTLESRRANGDLSGWDDGFFGDEPFQSALSANGRVIAFETGADDLVPNDNAFSTDTFLRDRGPLCPGDAGGDGFIGFADLNAVISAFNAQAGQAHYNVNADFDGDLDVDFADLNVVLSSFNQPC